MKLRSGCLAAEVQAERVILLAAAAAVIWLMPNLALRPAHHTQSSLALAANQTFRPAITTIMAMETMAVTPNLGEN